MIASLACPAVRVWIDQDLCTGDGLCTDHCPEVFRLLDDGISYVVDVTGAVHHQPGGAAQPAAVPAHLTDAVVAAASDCPGECIFIEEHATTATGTPGGAAGGADDPGDDDAGAERPGDAARPDGGDREHRWPRTVRVRWHHADGSTTVVR